MMEEYGEEEYEEVSNEDIANAEKKNQMNDSASESEIEDDLISN